MTATVTAELELHLQVPGGVSLPVAADVTYDARDPWAVKVVFLTGEDSTVEWLFARQLLTEGVAGPAGEGDVRVWPSMTDGIRTVSIAMGSPSGAALFEIERDAVVELLQRTYVAVPTGSEEDFVDLDAELALLLG